MNSLVGALIDWPVGVGKVVAVALVQRGQVDSLLSFPGLEEIMYLALSFWLAIAGAGPISLDRLLEDRKTT